MTLNTLALSTISLGTLSLLRTIHNPTKILKKGQRGKWTNLVTNNKRSRLQRIQPNTLKPLSLIAKMTKKKSIISHRSRKPWTSKIQRRISRTKQTTLSQKSSTKVKTPQMKRKMKIKIAQCLTSILTLRKKRKMMIWTQVTCPQTTKPLTLPKISNPFVWYNYCFLHRRIGDLKEE